MSRRARNRYDKRVILNPIAVAIEGAQKLPAVDRLNLQRIIQAAFDAFRLGQNCDVQWVVLADALNIAESMSQIGIASDEASVERIQRAEQVLADVITRHRERGTWALRGPELQALEDGVWTCKIQLEHCSLREFERARDATVERVRQARAGNAPKGAIIIEGAIA
jgi:hypothetical protein